MPRAADVDHVLLRHVEDGEPFAVPAELDEEDEHESWYRASFTVGGQRTHYRWLLDRGDRGYVWVSGAGLSTSDVGDGDDFVLSVDPGGPEWHLGSVVYEIFPDRFSRAGAASVADLPDWAVPREWDTLPEGRSRNTSREWFGGDLPGIEQRLDHIERLGANVLYLTPFFPAISTHRYDATTFDLVDPLLGGDEALDSLLAAAHDRGIRVLGDLTAQPLRVAATSGSSTRRPIPRRPERGFFYWGDEYGHGYAAWLGVRSLPKLNWSDAELRRRMLDVTRRWVRRGLDGWRIDVANMVARHGTYDANAEVGRAHAGGSRRRAGRRAPPRRARTRLPARPAGRRLARGDELRRLPAARLVVALQIRPPRAPARGLLGSAAGRPASPRR